QFQGSTPEQQAKTGKIMGGLTSFLGGGKLAEGLGQALAAPEVQNSIMEEQRETETMQQKLIDVIREKKTKGEDTSRLDKALKDSQYLAIRLGDVMKDFDESLVSNKEVVGSALRLATTLASGAIARGAASLVGFGKAVGTLPGILKGGAAGVISGGAVGGLQGVGVGLEKNQTTGEIVKSGAVGATGGALVGGALGTVVGGVQGHMKATQVAKENFVKELVSEPADKKEIIRGIAERRFNDPTFFRKATLNASKHDQKLIDVAKDVVKAEAGLKGNIEAMGTKQERINNAVKNYIAVHKKPIDLDMSRLAAKLESAKDESQLLFASDASAERTYNLVAKEFLKHVKNQDTLGVFEARQTFDKLPKIKKLLSTIEKGPGGFTENVRKEVILDIRRAVNEFVADDLPQGSAYRELLMRESYLIEGIWNAAENNYQQLGKNGLQILAEKYPYLYWIIAGTVGAAVYGLGAQFLGKAVGLGKVIVGSTD
ncbi:MAG: hypothetical protein AAB875_04585, partial [Patescibacteria group bacterium]